MKKIPVIFAFPTESFFALGVDARDKKAIQRLFRVKHREPGKPIALIASDMKQVKKYFFVSIAEAKLMQKHWPGALTILLKPKTPTTPHPSSGRRGQFIAARALGATRIGIRVPAHAGARRLAASVGAPITATSANISGRPATKSARKVKHDFPGILIMPGACGRATRPSTIINVVNNNVQIIRPGAVHV